MQNIYKNVLVTNERVHGVTEVALDEECEKLEV
jgi:hypothetical protein